MALVALALLLIAASWAVIFLWYIFWGLWLVPYRLIRRGQRKRRLEAARHRELLDVVEQAPSDGAPRARGY